MKKTLLIGCVLLSAFITAQAAEDEFDLNDVRLTRRQFVLPRHEVKFTAGPDGRWFTSDDAVYRCYAAEQNKKGGLTKKQGYEAGRDRVPFTWDDQLRELWVYRYDAKGLPAQEVFYKVEPPFKVTEDYRGLYQCNGQGKKVKAVRYRGKEIIRYIICEYNSLGELVKDVEYNNPGPDRNWFTPDDRIEKYHLREYDPEGKLARIREYHLDQQGRGQDNLWFTPDDVVSSAKLMVYDDTGLVQRINKYIGKGPDDLWFTDDDQLQYYSRMYYFFKK